MPTLLNHACLMLFSRVVRERELSQHAWGDAVPQHTVEQYPVGGQKGESRSELGRGAEKMDLFHRG
jgi:hypothetical protein